MKKKSEFSSGKKHHHVSNKVFLRLNDIITRLFKYICNMHLFFTVSVHESIQDMDLMKLLIFWIHPGILKIVWPSLQSDKEAKVRS